MALPKTNFSSSFILSEQNRLGKTQTSKKMRLNYYFILGTMLLFAHFGAKAQSTPEAFLAQFPPIPSNICKADTSTVNHFTSQIYKVKSALQQVTDRINTELQANEEKFKDKVAQQSGLNKADMEQLQQENATEEHALMAANKIIGEQYNLSLQELENVGEMSDADQEKWAQNYAAKATQQAMQNPQATLKKQEKSARLFELAKEQKAIGDRITDRMSRIDKLFKNIEQQDTIETRKLNEKLRPLEKQLCMGICSPAEIARSHAAEKQIYSLKLQYCEKMSPLQINYISQYQTDIKILFPDYRRLAEVQNEIVRLQTGVIVPPDLSCYSAVEEYANVLAEAYKYWVGKFEQ